MLVAAAALHFLPFVPALDLKLLDAGFAALRTVAPTTGRDDIVIIGIDDATLQAFPEPFALWHAHLGDMLTGLATARPRAVGIDIELPERSYDFVRPGSDRQLLAGLLALRSAAPLVVARGVDRSGNVRPLHILFAAAAGEDGTGLAIWPLDRDGRVRRFDERLGDRGTTVPTFVGTLARRLGREPGSGLIDLSLGQRYTYVPAHTAIAWAREGQLRTLERAFAGRIVLVGSVLPFVDRHPLAVPLTAWEDGPTAPGILLHAQALRSILGPGLIRPAPAWVSLVLLAVASLAWFVHGRAGRASVLLAGVLAGMLAAALWLLHSGIHLPLAGGLATAALAGSARVSHDAWFNRRERERLKHSFQGYVSPNVLELILRGDLDSDLGTGRRMLCVLFADIRNFTALTEHAPPEGIVELLNAYFERMTCAIHAHDGTVDNFRGDGIMCFFGAPRPTGNPCAQGFFAAKAMLAALAELNRELESRALPALRIGLSLAYGEAIVGRIGASSRHEYTAIGDVANVSARLETMTKETGYPLLVSGPVFTALDTAEPFDDLGPREIRGHAPVHVFGWPARDAGDGVIGIATVRASHG